MNTRAKRAGLIILTLEPDRQAEGNPAGVTKGLKSLHPYGAGFFCFDRGPQEDRRQAILLGSLARQKACAHRACFFLETFELAR